MVTLDDDNGHEYLMIAVTRLLRREIDILLQEMANIYHLLNRLIHFCQKLKYVRLRKWMWVAFEVPDGHFVVEAAEALEVFCR